MPLYVYANVVNEKDFSIFLLRSFIRAMYIYLNVHICTAHICNALNNNNNNNGIIYYYNIRTKY